MHKLHLLLVFEYEFAAPEFSILGHSLSLFPLVSICVCLDV